MPDHRIAALKALGYIPQAKDELRHAALASEATAHALLAVAARLGEVVEQQCLANVIAAIGAVRSGSTGLVNWDDAKAAETYVRAHIGDIVNPDPNGDT
ncbi:hypothetical protein [Nocardia sp. NBC_01009]|uniref:hypothetical protein n=1 Tax=Nocardia sp. NBC_01009 TaxID=2975996 RepID=UPI00386E3E52|nr:hypothetical protein OHA42_05055 [Nocardia sp. NBC_01009]